MVPKVADAVHRTNFVVWVQFTDGTEGEIDLESELWGPMFEPLSSQEEFERLRLDSELGTLVWPNGADFAPAFLYQKLVPTYKLKPMSQSGAA